MSEITVRQVTESDLSVLAGFMRQLNEYEGLGDRCIISEEAYREMIFDEKCLHGLIAESEGKPVGAALYYFYRISSLGGRKVLYLEELFVSPEERRKGVGRLLIDEIKRAAKEEKALRIEWKCLKDNPSLAFYDKICERQASDDWVSYEIYFNKF